MFSTRIPPNILIAGQTYRWRVRVADGADWIEVNNRSHNQWQKIRVAQTLREREYTYSIPVELDDGWQTSSLLEEGVSKEKINELMQRILNGHDQVKNVHSVLLVKNGKLALEEYFYGTHRNHMHTIQSDTKSVLSILMVIAVDEGIIKNVDQPILEFFPEIHPAKLDADKRAITIGWAEMRLKPRDMAKIGYMMLKGGSWKSRPIVSHNWVKESTRAHIKAGQYQYGYQWWRGQTIANNQMIDAFWAWGHGGQFIFVLPELDLVVVFTAKHHDNPGSSERAFNMLTNYIIPAVIPTGPPRNIVKVAPEVLETYVGTYTFKHDNETETAHIFVENSKLYGRGNDDDIAELYASGLY